MFTKNLFTNWHFMRFLRLGLGLFIAYQAIYSHDTISGLIALFFLFQAVTDSGCGGAAGCVAPPPNKRNEMSTQDVTFEEIK